MANINQSMVKSGFDIEVLMGQGYLQMLIQTAFDAGMIPDEAYFNNTHVLLSMLGSSARLYEPTLGSNGLPRPEHSDAFQTTILFGHALGANVKVRLMIGTETLPAVPFDLFLQLDLKKTIEENALTYVGMAIHVVDVDTPIFQFLENQFGLTKAMILAKLVEFVDRTIDIGGAAKFKKVEDLNIKFHEGDQDHPPALGLYINIFLRNGDEDDQFLAVRGDLTEASNFLPIGEDIAMSSRPGMYRDMAKDVFSRTAIENEAGHVEHAFRKALLNPNSTRLGDLNKVKISQIPPIMTGGGNTISQNGMRITIEGEIIDPIDLTSTDLTYTVDIRPVINDDGTLSWDTNFNADVDAVFEFLTIWTATLLGILLGPAGALTFLGVVFLAELGVGIGISLYKEGSVATKADAALADVIPDRLTIATRRWDPFYATLHQVVIKPNQAEFNNKGFMLCGKAFVGRQLVPPENTIIRDELRDNNNVLIGMRYYIADYETVLKEVQLLAPGTSRRAFEMPTTEEPSLWGLTLPAFQERKDDPEGPLIITRIPYFLAAVHIKEHQIDTILCLSATEIKEIQDMLRAMVWERKVDDINRSEGNAIRQAVIEELGPNVSEEEIEVEVKKRIDKKVKRLMDKYRSPEPLEMVFTGILQPYLRFDITPEELILLQEKQVLLIDRTVNVIHGRRVSAHVRDHADYIPGPKGDEDNLLNRPKYKPTPAGPVFS